MCISVTFLNPLKHPVSWVLSFYFRENRGPARLTCMTGVSEWLCVGVATCISGHILARVQPTVVVLREKPIHLWTYQDCRAYE